MKISYFVSLTVGVCLLALLASAGFAEDEADAKQQKKKSSPQPQIVGKIVGVEYAVEKINPPNLVVTATGEVPTAGYQKPALERVSYVDPPADGIQDYFLRATPPSEVADQVVSKVKATDTWKGYTEEAPWIKGIRVHGTGDGVMVKMFSGEPADEKGKNQRAFEGQSNDGQLQAALDEALTQLDKALGEGGVADAMATWTITKVTGQRGGIAGLHSVKVTITATRTPPWGE